jgi:hypothetical protein
VLALATDCADAFRSSEDLRISEQRRREDAIHRAREELAGEARQRLADPFLDTEERQFWIEEFPDLADWRPSQQAVRAAVVPKVLSATMTLRRSLLPPQARAEAQHSLDQVEARFPGIVAEILSEQAVSASAGTV